MRRYDAKTRFLNQLHFAAWLYKEFDIHQENTKPDKQPFQMHYREYKYLVMR